MINSVTPWEDRYDPEGHTRGAPRTKEAAMALEIAELRASVFALTGEVANKADYAARMYSMHEVAKAERDALQAKLDALQTQEPVGFVAPHELKDLKEGFPITVVLFSSHKRTSPLYAAPKALAPLTLEQMDKGQLDYVHSTADFKAGARFAEKHHGIGSTPC